MRPRTMYSVTSYSVLSTSHLVAEQRGHLVEELHVNATSVDLESTVLVQRSLGVLPAAELHIAVPAAHTSHTRV